jgi:hypothetical protein
MTKFRLAIPALAVMLGGSAALADDLSLGPNYVPVVVLEGGVGATNVGGGPITTSTLNGTQLAYVYCVGFFTDVFVPDDYPDTTVTTNGVVNGAMVHNAGEIAWLLDNFAVASLGTTIDEQALQAAIWSVEYDDSSAPAIITGDPGQSYYSQYQADLTALGSKTADLDTIDWFSPGNGSGTMYQGLVGPGSGGTGTGLQGEAPEPTSILLFGTVLMFFAGIMKRKTLRIGR